MKKLLTFLLLLKCSLTLLYGQDKPYFIKRDTINIRGYVYNNFGQPAKNILIRSTALDIRYNAYVNEALTRDDGYFELRGARFNDTLDFSGPDGGLRFYNRGSRYVEIRLPWAQPAKVNPDKAIMVIAKRIVPKKPVILKILPDPIILDNGCSIQSIPGFPGGTQNFSRYIYNKLRYPQEAIKNNIEGGVEVTFTITKDGSIAKVKAIKGIGYGCDEAAIAVIKTSPKWSPGVQCGRAVETAFSVAIQFKLIDK